MADLIINGKDAFQEWGVRIGESFISNILSPAPLKDFLENESGLEHGKQVIYTSPRLADRDITLNFEIEGDNPDDYLSKYTLFIAELQGGKVAINIPVLGQDVYKLTYKMSTSFAMNIERTFGKIAVKFNEANPNDRKY